jgi:3-oxoadipate enol-lactonase
LAHADLRDQLDKITSPALLIAGLRDEVTTPADALFMRDRIAQATYVEIDAAHLSNIEAAGQFTCHLQDFLQ